MDTKDIEKFDPTKAELNKLVKSTQGLTVSDLEDKEQLEVVRKGRIELKNMRVKITKYGKGLREDANAFLKAVLSKEKELIEIIEPEETRLKAIEEEASMLAIKKERLEKLPVRKERLESIGDKIQATDNELLSMDSNEFEAYVNTRTAKKLDTDREELERIAREQEEKSKVESDKKEEEMKAREDELKIKEKANLEKERQIEAEKKLLEENRLKAEEEKDKLEKQQIYRDWRNQFKYTPENKEEFKEEKVGDTIVLWKKLGTFNINSK